MKTIASFLVASLLTSGAAFAGDNSNDFAMATLEEAYADASLDERLDEFGYAEIDQKAIGVGTIIGIAISAVALGCTYAYAEGKALARRDPSALRTYSKNRWKIRAAVLAASPGGLAILRCFEHGLMGTM